MTIRSKCVGVSITSIVVVVVVVIAAFVAGMYSRQYTRAGNQPEPAAAAVLAEAASPPAGQQMYTCSMHPSVRSPDAKDKCPICGMDLIPVPADEDESEQEGALPRLALSRRAEALLNVQTWPAERRDVPVELPLYGRINLDETRLRSITAWLAGRLEKLHVDFTGVSVRQGDPMVEIYSPELIVAQSELINTVQARGRQQRTGAETIRTTDAVLNAGRFKLRQLGLTQEQIAAIEGSEKVNETLTIVAPVDGIVTERHVTEGAHVERGDPIYSLADLSTVWVELSVYESDLKWLKTGQPVTFTAEAFPGDTFTGEIVFIDPMLDENTRTVRVRADMENPGGRLRPGMFLRGSVEASLSGAIAELEEGTLPLVIPATAPLITGQRAVVYVRVSAAERPTYEARQVTLGPRARGYYAVLDGLIEGELVVTNGNFKIDSELQIRGRPSMMSPQDPEKPRDSIQIAGADEEPEPVEVPDAFRQALDPVYRAYLAAQQALASDDLEAFRSAAAQLHNTLDQVDANALDPPAAEQWEQLKGRMKEGQEHLLHMDIEAARAQFETWSMAAIALGKRMGHGGTMDLRVAHCPMAFDDRGGDWLQESEQIRNPYYGASMLKCGEIKSRVPADPAPAT
jgi:membrane fusion protein, copper/silver efflux system